MRISYLLPILLLFGCIGTPLEPALNITKADSEWSRYNGFVSFEFPSTMALTHQLSDYEGGAKTASVVGSDSSHGKTILALIYTNITQYGSDTAYRADPQETARSFLASDRVTDPTGLMMNARDISEIAVHNESGKVFIAQANFSISIIGGDNQSKMSGIALNIYYPERQALYRFRVISEQGSFSSRITDRFEQSFEG